MNAMTPSSSSTAAPRLSVSSWSLNRTLGSPPFFGADSDGPPAASSSSNGLPLLELPKRIAEFGIGTMELCHFHLPSRDAAYLAQLRAALQAANVELWSLLIDDGDITHPQNAARDLEWIKSWIDVAAQLGAKNARVIAGKGEPTPENLAKSRQGLETLAQHAEAQDVGLLIENWFALLARPEDVLWMLDETEGRIGLNADFGNWSGPDKYDALSQIFPHAKGCHTKCRFIAPHQMDKDDFVRCLDLSRAAGFSGPHTLIYDGKDDDEWGHLALEREVVSSYL
jgi:sugar phosphate isomerase/epimerase